jgi:translation initiation factor 2A
VRDFDPLFYLCILNIEYSVCIYDTNTAQAIREFSLPNIVEVGISPKGNFLSTWERPGPFSSPFSLHGLWCTAAKLEDGSQHKNLRVFSIETGEQVASFSQKSQEGWDLQYTPTETHALRLVGPDIQVYHPADWAKGIADKLHVEGMTNFSLSPGANPSVAVFVAEKKVLFSNTCHGYWLTSKTFRVPPLA